MKIFEQKEPTLRSRLQGKKAKHHYNKKTKKMRNKSFRMYLKQNNNSVSEKDHKRSFGTEF